jgi:hypothetical protein
MTPHLVHFCASADCSSGMAIIEGNYSRRVSKCHGQNTLYRIFTPSSQSYDLYIITSYYLRHDACPDARTTRHSAPILPAIDGTSAAINTCCTAAHLPWIGSIPPPVYKPLNNFPRSYRSATSRTSSAPSVIKPALSPYPPMRSSSVPIRSPISSLRFSPTTSPYLRSLSPTMESVIGVFPSLPLNFTSLFFL